MFGVDAVDEEWFDEVVKAGDALARELVDGLEEMPPMARAMAEARLEEWEKAKQTPATRQRW